MSDIQFAGFPVTFRKIDDTEVLVHCKNVIGTYTQAKAFVERSNPSNTYQFGVKTTMPSFIYVSPNDRIRIACLEDTKENFMALYEECERLLSKPMNILEKTNLEQGYKEFEQGYKELELNSNQ